MAAMVRKSNSGIVYDMWQVRYVAGKLLEAVTEFVEVRSPLYAGVAFRSRNYYFSYVCNVFASSTPVRSYCTS